MVVVIEETVKAGGWPAANCMRLITLLASALAWPACSSAPRTEPAHLETSDWRLEGRDSCGREWKSEAALAGRGLVVWVNTDDDNMDGFIDSAMPLPVEGEDNLAAVRVIGVPASASVSFSLTSCVSFAGTRDLARLFFRPNRTLPVETCHWRRSDDAIFGGEPTVFIEGVCVGTAELLVCVRDAAGRVTSRRIAI